MVHSSPINVIVQNLFMQWPFTAALFVVIVLTGAWKGCLLALVVASLVGFVYRKFVNKLLPVPRKTAVFITGCSTGIGYETAIRLSKIGFMTFATVRKTEDADKLKKATGNSAMLIPVICDLAVEADRIKAVETVKSKLAPEGRKLIALINNAGYAAANPIELASSEDIRAQFDINVFAIIHLSQLFLPLLREAASDQHWARIINISSVLGRLKLPGMGLYNGSKHALEAISGSMRMELAKWKIHVSIVEPASTRTPLWTSSDERAKKAAASRDQLKKEGKLYCSNDVIQSYAESEAKAAAQVEKSQGRMPGPAEVTRTIEAALLDSRPLPVYMSGWEALACLPVLHLPDEITDRMMAGDWQ